MPDLEAVILEELDRLAPAVDPFEPAWEEIMRGALPARRRLTPRRVGLYVLAFAIVVYLAAPAFGLGMPFLDFFSSTPSPKQVVKDFAQQNAAGSLAGVSPRVLAGQARRVTVYRLRDGRPFPLDVAPRRGGGFCFDFAFSGSCAAARARRQAEPNQPGDHNAAAIGLVRIGYHRSSVLAGYVYDKRIAKLVIRFRGQRPVHVPLLWVSAPIDAGFFAYDLTEFQRVHHSVVAVVAVDAHGKEFARIGSIFRPAPAWANWRNVADLSKRHVILRSGDAYIELAPSRTGGNCFWVRSADGAGGSGCAPPRYLTQPMAGGLTGTIFSAQVKPAVTRVELRFQGGTHVVLRPVEGFVLYSIPRGHWPRGQRLTAAVAYSSAGKQLARQEFDPAERGLYPCSRPRPIGGGLKACP